MATSKVQIVNLALASLGEPPLADFSDPGRAAQLARDTYLEFRDAVFEEFPWNFTRTRATATASAQGPAWGEGYAYVCDPKCLFVVYVQGEDDRDWKVENVIQPDNSDAKCIVTSIESPINYIYTRKIDDVPRYTALFVTCLAARLALEWAEPLGKSNDLIEKQSKLYQAKIRLARSRNSQEGTPNVNRASEWVDARRGAAPVLAKLDGDPQPL